MSKKLNKRRALRQLAKDASNRKIVRVPWGEMRDASSEYDIWDTYFSHWNRLMKIKHPAGFELATWVDDSLRLHPAEVIIVSEARP